jgi:hypothetical protein
MRATAAHASVFSSSEQTTFKLVSFHHADRDSPGFRPAGISKPDALRSCARQSVVFSKFVHRLATVATVLECPLAALDGRATIPP